MAGTTEDWLGDLDRRIAELEGSVHLRETAVVESKNQNVDTRPQADHIAP